VGRSARQGLGVGGMKALSITLCFELDVDRLVTVKADGSGDLTVLRYPRDFPIYGAATIHVSPLGDQAGLKSSLGLLLTFRWSLPSASIT
jgi:hypothetical protein